ncbi:hypothetical protein LSH36_55g09041 [Paralvinella palmiformis]|uniref:G-protein coupled receptors family 2 profile 2 domain-containing protein n=1 Tax=Paralvinella palmiformis TaxID=53620 RepID=A0AAD9NE00_9ANNE|nr:hypothetical protein LSH36_55g09041 [Paralvinella palmiformis]
MVNPHVCPEVNEGRWNRDSDAKTTVKGLKSSLQSFGVTVGFTVLKNSLDYLKEPFLYRLASECFSESNTIFNRQFELWHEDLLTPMPLDNEEYGKAVSTLTSPETLAVWNTVTDKDLVIAISKNILVGMEDMVSGLFNVMEVGNVTSQTNLSVTEDNLDGRYGFYRAQYDTMEYLLNMKPISDPSGSNATMSINSKIISARFVGPGLAHISNLSTPLTITLKHNNVQIPDVHNKALSYISYIGGTLSIIGCLASIGAYEFFRLSSERIRVHEMLAISIILSQLTFFIGFEQTEYKVSRYLFDYNMFPVSVPFVRHFVTLHADSDVLLDVSRRHPSLHLTRQSLQEEFQSEEVLPDRMGFDDNSLIMLVLTNKLLKNANCKIYLRCWLSNHLLLVAFIPFVAVVILINLSVMILVIRVMIKSMKKYGKNEDIPAAKYSLKAIITLMPLLGFTWVFGFMSVDEEATLVFTYLFAIFNSLQASIQLKVRRSYERRYHRHRYSSSSNPVKVAGRDCESYDVGSCKGSPQPIGSVDLNDVIKENDALRRKRSSAISIDSTDTNMTVVEENGNAVTDNNPDDYMYFRRTSTTDRRKSRPSGAGPGSSIRRSAKTGTGTGIVIGTDELPVRSDGSGTGINDVRADVDSVFDYVPDDVTHYDVYVTHM